MPTSLLAIAKKAQERKDTRFFNLYRLIDENFLLECWSDIRKNAAYGVDRISAQQYCNASRFFHAPSVSLFRVDSGCCWRMVRRLRSRV